MLNNWIKLIPIVEDTLVYFIFDYHSNLIIFINSKHTTIRRCLKVDILSRTTLRTKDSDPLEGFQVGRSRPRLTHLQFVNDIIFVSRASMGDLKNLKLDKSTFININVNQDGIASLASMLECIVSEWPLTYLGLPLRNPKANVFWHPVIDRISQRLDGWRKVCLSLGGWITLIQSCLSHILNYFLFVYRIPLVIASNIETMQRDFIWPGVRKGKMNHLISWEQVHKPKLEGGLGLEKISLRNRAILGKWLYRNPRKCDAIWHKVILSIWDSSQHRYP